MSTGRPISRDDALLLISGWRDSCALIDARCEVAPLAFSFRGRVFEFIVSSGRVRFLHVSGRDEFVFDLMRDFECWYADPRDVPEEAKTLVGGIVFLFPDSRGSGKNVITLVEVKEEKSNS